MVFVDDPDGLGVARLIGFEQFLGLFLILLQVGAKWLAGDPLLFGAQRFHGIDGCGAARGDVAGQ